MSSISATALVFSPSYFHFFFSMSFSIRCPNLRAIFRRAIFSSDFTPHRCSEHQYKKQFSIQRILAVCNYVEPNAAIPQHCSWDDSLATYAKLFANFAASFLRFNPISLNSTRSLGTSSSFRLKDLVTFMDLSDVFIRQVPHVACCRSRGTLASPLSVILFYLLVKLQ